MILSILLATLIPLIFLYIIWSLEIYALARFKLLLAALAWGAAAFGVALVIQTILLRAEILSLNQITLVSAPILEELLKAVLIIGLSARMHLRYAVDGTAYGFAIGTGFAIGENLLYVSQTPENALGEIFARLLSSSLMHMFTTAIVGTVAGSGVYFARPTRSRRLIVALVSVALVHGVFNRIAGTQEGLALLILGMAIGIGSTGILVILINQQLKTERDSIERELSVDLSRGEIAAALNPQQITDSLSRHRGEIDPQQARLIQEYITLQA